MANLSLAIWNTWNVTIASNASDTSIKVANNAYTPSGGSAAKDLKAAKAANVTNADDVFMISLS